MTPLAVGSPQATLHGQAPPSSTREMRGADKSGKESLEAKAPSSAMPMPAAVAPVGNERRDRLGTKVVRDAVGCAPADGVLPHLPGPLSAHAVLTPVRGVARSFDRAATPTGTGDPRRGGADSPGHGAASR